MANAPGTDAMNPSDVLAAFETMARLYRSLGRLSERQRRAIEIGDTAALMRVLDARDAALDRLRAIQPGVERAVEAWREAGRGMPETIRQRVRALLEEIDRVLKEVMAADAEDSQRLVLRQAAVSDRLSQHQAAARAARAYRVPSPAPGGSRLDVKDEQG